MTRPNSEALKALTKTDKWEKVIYRWKYSSQV